MGVEGKGIDTIKIVVQEESQEVTKKLNEDKGGGDGNVKIRTGVKKKQ